MSDSNQKSLSTKPDQSKLSSIKKKVLVRKVVVKGVDGKPLLDDKGNVQYKKIIVRSKGDKSVVNLREGKKVLKKILVKRVVLKGPDGKPVLDEKGKVQYKKVVVKKRDSDPKLTKKPEKKGFFFSKKDKTKNKDKKVKDTKVSVRQQQEKILLDKQAKPIDEKLTKQTKKQKRIKLPKELNKPVSDQSIKVRETTNLFDVIGYCIYTSIIGCFFASFILFFVLLFLKPIYTFSYLTLYSGLGVFVYWLGYYIWRMGNNTNIIPNTNKLGRQKLEQYNKVRMVWYLIINSVIYLLLAWLLMILIGSFKGFNIMFLDNIISSDTQKAQVFAFGEQSMWVHVETVGFILFYTTLSVVLLSFLIYWRYQKWKINASKTLAKRRAMISQMQKSVQKELE